MDIFTNKIQLNPKDGQLICETSALDEAGNKGANTEIQIIFTATALATFRVEAANGDGESKSFNVICPANDTKVINFQAPIPNGHSIRIFQVGSVAGSTQATIIAAAINTY